MRTNVPAPTIDLTLEQMDLSTPAFGMLPDPQREAAFARMRAEAPVSFCRRPSFRGSLRARASGR
jgi:hypothetical protein